MPVYFDELNEPEREETYLSAYAPNDVKRQRRQITLRFRAV